MITIRIIQAAIGEANRTKDGRRYLVRGAGNPWSEWLNATSRPLAAETTSLSNLLPDARGPISPVPSETRSFANGGERERGGGEDTLQLGRGIPGSCSRGPPSTLPERRPACRPRNVHHRLHAARRCPSALQQPPRSARDRIESPPSPRFSNRVPERGGWIALNGARQTHREIDQDVSLQSAHVLVPYVRAHATSWLCNNRG